MSESQQPRGGPGPKAAKVLIDARVLQGPGAGRGEGTYARGLLGGLAAAGFAERAILLLDADLPVPNLPGGAWETASARRRYRGRLAAYEDAVALSADIARIGPGAFHALRLSLPGRAPCPVAVTLHDLIPWALGGARLLGERFRHLPAKRLLKRADLVIAVSEATASDAERIGGVRRSRIRVIQEGVEPRFRPLPGAAPRVSERWGIDRPYLLYVGALDARKSPRDLLAAWREAVSAGADCDLVIAGDPGAQAPGALPGARLLGRVGDDELVDLLSAAACLLFPSRYEGFGLPVLEAMACGCPVVCYSNSSLPEVAGAAGILVPDGDAVGMGRRAAQLVLDAASSKRVRAAGLEQAGRFTWEIVAAEVIEAYATLLR